MTPQNPYAERPPKDAGPETDGEEEPPASTANEPPSFSDGPNKKRSGVARWRRSHVACPNGGGDAVESGIAEGSGRHAEQADENSSRRNGAVRRRRDPRTAHNVKGKPSPFPTEATAETELTSSGTPSNLVLITAESEPATVSLRQQSAVSDEVDAPIPKDRAELTGSEAEFDCSASTTAATVELQAVFKRAAPVVKCNRRRGSDDESDDGASMLAGTDERRSVRKRTAPAVKGNRRRRSEDESDDGAAIPAGTAERRSVFKRTAPAVRSNCRRRAMDRREPHQGTGKEPSASIYRSRPAPAGKPSEQRAEKWRPSQEKARNGAAGRKPSGRRPNAPRGDASASHRAGPSRNRDGSVTAQEVDGSAISIPNTDPKSAPRSRNWRSAGPARLAPATSWRKPAAVSSSQQPTRGETRTWRPKRRDGISKVADPVAGGDAACAPIDRRRSWTWRAPKAAKDNGPAGARNNSPSNGAAQSTTVRGYLERGSEPLTRNEKRLKSSVPRGGGTGTQRGGPPAKYGPAKASATWCKQASLETHAKKSGGVSINNHKSSPRAFYNSENTLPKKPPAARVRRPLTSTATSVQELDSGGSESSGGVSSSLRRPVVRRRTAEGTAAAGQEAADTLHLVSGHSSSWTGQRLSGSRRPWLHKRLPRTNARREFPVQFEATDAVAFPRAVGQRRRNASEWNTALLLAALLASALVLVLFVALRPSGFRWAGCSALDLEGALPGMRKIVGASAEACRQSRESTGGCSYRMPLSCEELNGIVVGR